LQLTTEAREAIDAVDFLVRGEAESPKRISTETNVILVESKCSKKQEGPAQEAPSSSNLLEIAISSELESVSAQVSSGSQTTFADANCSPGASQATFAYVEKTEEEIGSRIAAAVPLSEALFPKAVQENVQKDFISIQENVQKGIIPLSSSSNTEGCIPPCQIGCLDIETQRSNDLETQSLASIGTLQSYVNNFEQSSQLVEDLVVEYRFEGDETVKSFFNKAPSEETDSGVTTSAQKHSNLSPDRNIKSTSSSNSSSKQQPLLQPPLFQGGTSVCATIGQETAVDIVEITAEDEAQRAVNISPDVVSISPDVVSISPELSNITFETSAAVEGSPETNERQSGLEGPIIIPASNAGKSFEAYSDDNWHADSPPCATSYETAGKGEGVVETFTPVGPSSDPAASGVVCDSDSDSGGTSDSRENAPFDHRETNLDYDVEHQTNYPSKPLVSFGTVERDSSNQKESTFGVLSLEESLRHSIAESESALKDSHTISFTDTNFVVDIAADYTGNPAASPSSPTGILSKSNQPVGKQIAFESNRASNLTEPRKSAGLRRQSIELLLAATGNSVSVTSQRRGSDLRKKRAASCYAPERVLADLTKTQELDRLLYEEGALEDLLLVTEGKPVFSPASAEGRRFIEIAYGSEISSSEDEEEVLEARKSIVDSRSFTAKVGDSQLYFKQRSQSEFQSTIGAQQSFGAQKRSSKKKRYPKAKPRGSELAGRDRVVVYSNILDKKLKKAGSTRRFSLDSFDKSRVELIQACPNQIRKVAENTLDFQPKREKLDLKQIDVSLPPLEKLALKEDDSSLPPIYNRDDVIRSHHLIRRAAESPVNNLLAFGNTEYYNLKTIASSRNASLSPSNSRHTFSNSVLNSYDHSNPSLSQIPTTSSARLNRNSSGDCWEQDDYFDRVDRLANRPETCPPILQPSKTYRKTGYYSSSNTHNQSANNLSNSRSRSCSSGKDWIEPGEMVQRFFLPPHERPRELQKQWGGDDRFKQRKDFQGCETPGGPEYYLYSARLTAKAYAVDLASYDYRNKMRKTPSMGIGERLGGRPKSAGPTGRRKSDDKPGPGTYILPSCFDPPKGRFVSPNLRPDAKLLGVQHMGPNAKIIAANSNYSALANHNYHQSHYYGVKDGYYNGSTSSGQHDGHHGHSSVGHQVSSSGHHDAQGREIRQQRTSNVVPSVVPAFANGSSANAVPPSRPTVTADVNQVLKGSAPLNNGSGSNLFSTPDLKPAETPPTKSTTGPETPSPELSQSKKSAVSFDTPE